MKRVVIFGGTGFIGLHLAKHLASKGMTPLIVARHKPKADTEFKFVQWDARSLGEWVEEMNDAEAIVNLAGKSVDCIKSPANCDVILRSRVESTRIIAKAIRSIERPPKVWIQMSTAHIYGDPPNTMCTEESPIGYGLAPDVGTAWEKEFNDGLLSTQRGLCLRTSFVLGKNGGALENLKRIA